MIRFAAIVAMLSGCAWAQFATPLLPQMKAGRTSPALPSGCILNLDASSLQNFVLSGSNVVTWLDSSSSGNNVGQSVAGKRPIFTTNAGYSCVLYPTTQSPTMCLTSQPFVAQTTGTFLCVFQLIGSGTWFYEMDIVYNNTGGFYFYSAVNCTASIHINANESYADASAGATWFGTSRACAVFEFTNAASPTLWLQRNGTNLLTTAGTKNALSIGTVTNAINIGSRNNGSSVPSAAYVNQIVIWPRPLSAAELSSAWHVMKAKWGL